MNKLNLRWQDNMSPDIDAHNLQLMTDGINNLIDETENIENKISEIESTKVIANPKRKPKYALNTILIGDDVYLVDGNAGTTVYDLLGTQTGEVAKAFSPKEDTKQIILMAVYNRVFQGSATIDLEEKTIKGTIASVEKELYDKYVGQLWDEDKSYKNTFEYNIVSDDVYSFYWNGEDGFGTEELRVESTGKLLVTSSYYELEVAIIAVEKSADIGITSWEELENKPFESLNDDNFEVSEDGVLSVIGGGFDGEKNGIEKTQAEYDALKEAGQLERDVNYYITDGESGGDTINADHVLMSDGTNVEETVSTLKTSLNNIGKKIEMNVTSNSNGIITPTQSLNANKYTVISVHDNASSIVIPMVASSDNTWRFKLLTNDTMAARANQSCILTVYVQEY